MTLLVKPIFGPDGKDVVGLGELTPNDIAQIVGPLVVESDSEFNSAGSIKLPVGTTDERPANPKIGSTRFNIDLGWAESWDGKEWLKGSGPAGADGDSAYDIAVENGFVGTEAEWVDSLQGEDGPTVVSQDADNIAILGTDGFIFVPKGGEAGQVPVGTTAERPNPPITGNLRFNTTLDRLEVYGNSFWQILKYDREATAPIIGTATPTSNTAATVTYSPSANESIEAVTGYKGVSDPDGVIATKAGTGAGTLTFNGLKQGTKYTFKVCGLNVVGDGYYAGPSNEILTYSVPNAPVIGGATANTDGTSALVAYSPPAYNGGAPITSYTATSTPDGKTGVLNQAGGGNILVAGLNPNKKYTFTVRATNIYGNSIESDPTNEIGWTVPSAPIIGTATIYSTTATINFNAPTNSGGMPVTNYTAISSPAGFTASSATSPISVSGLEVGVAYTFQVFATNGIGNSENSATSNSVTPTIYIPPANSPSFYSGSYRTSQRSDGAVVVELLTSGELNLPNDVNSEYLVVAGGGGGGCNNPGVWNAGGAGAGGLLEGSKKISKGKYTVMVGAGGPGGPNTQNPGSKGSDSVIDLITAIGGGSGAGSGASPGTGGSGGGNVGDNNGGRNGAAGTPGQGNSGGSGSGTTGGGGGGAGGAGVTGAGGPGKSSNISGSAVTYAAGGTHMGGQGQIHGPANSGNGGSAGNNNPGGNGGSGIIVLAWK